MTRTLAEPPLAGRGRLPHPRHQLQAQEETSMAAPMLDLVEEVRSIPAPPPQIGVAPSRQSGGVAGQQLQLALVRAALRTATLLAPPLAASLAARLFLTPPRAREV